MAPGGPSSAAAVARAQPLVGLAGRSPRAIRRRAAAAAARAAATAPARRVLLRPPRRAAGCGATRPSPPTPAARAARAPPPSPPPPRRRRRRPPRRRRRRRVERGDALAPSSSSASRPSPTSAGGIGVRASAASTAAAAAAPNDVAARAVKAQSGERPLPSTASCVASYGQWCSASPTAAAATIRRRVEEKSASAAGSGRSRTPPRARLAQRLGVRQQEDVAARVRRVLRRPQHDAARQTLDDEGEAAVLLALRKGDAHQRADQAALGAGPQLVALLAEAVRTAGQQDVEIVVRARLGQQALEHQRVLRLPDVQRDLLGRQNAPRKAAQRHVEEHAEPARVLLLGGGRAVGWTACQTSCEARPAAIRSRRRRQPSRRRRRPRCPRLCPPSCVAPGRCAGVGETRTRRLRASRRRSRAERSPPASEVAPRVCVCELMVLFRYETVGSRARHALSRPSSRSGRGGAAPSTPGPPVGVGCRPASPSR